MKHSSSDIPVACRLSSAEFRAREATLLARFMLAVSGMEELPDGYAFQMPGDEKSITAVAELIVAERECCPFLKFELAAQPNMGPLLLRVTGPSGTKDFLKITFCKRERSF